VRAGSCGFLFPFRDLLRELLLEALDAAGGIDQLLLASEEGMAIRADFDAKRLARKRRARFKFISTARAMYADGVVIRMDSFFHIFSYVVLTDLAVHRGY